MGDDPAKKRGAAGWDKVRSGQEWAGMVMPAQRVYKIFSGWEEIDGA
jgi:hypothetical protein